MGNPTRRHETQPLRGLGMVLVPGLEAVTAAAKGQASSRRDRTFRDTQGGLELPRCSPAAFHAFCYRLAMPACLAHEAGNSHLFH